MTTLAAAADRLYSSVRGWWAFLAVLFVAAALVRLACYTGIIGSDDLWYVRYAERIAAGEFPRYTNQYTGRTGLTFAVAAVYRLFGVGEATTVMVPLVAASASVPLLAVIGARLYGPLAGGIAALLLCTSPIHVRFATILVPEPLMEFWILVAVWCYLEAARRGSRVLAALSGVSVGVAYLTKEPAAFVAPALALAAWTTGRRSLAVMVTVGALAVAGAEMVTYAAIFDAPLHRLDAARVGVPVVTNAHVRDGVTRSQWLQNRLFVSYPRRMIYPNLDFGLHYLVALTSAAIAMLVLRRERTLLALWAALPWAFLNFGSVSLNRYSPIWASERYISVTLAPLFLLAAGLFVSPRTFRYPLARSFGLAVVVTVSAVGIACGWAVRASGFRTREVAILRSILTASLTDGTAPCHSPGPPGDHARQLGGDQIDYWTDALRFFNPHGGSITAGESLVIKTDVLGLPAVEPGVCDNPAAQHLERGRAAEGPVSADER